jgi:protease I
MSRSFKNKTVAILPTDGFEYVELMEPRKALDEAGASTQVVSLKAGKIQGWNHQKPGDSVNVDVALTEADPDNYDALLLPGGVMNPDQCEPARKRFRSCARSLRLRSRSLRFVTDLGC